MFVPQLQASIVYAHAILEYVKMIFNFIKMPSNMSNNLQQHTFNNSFLKCSRTDQIKT